MDKKEVVPCVFCKEKPKIYHYAENIWYVICSTASCKTHTKFGTYNCLGSTEALAINQWNIQNRPLNRECLSSKKRKDVKDSDL